MLGEQDAAGAVQRAHDVAASCIALTDRTVVPTFGIIATVASAGAGDDGNYSDELAVDGTLPWVEAAAAAGICIVIDLQRGRTGVNSVGTWLAASPTSSARRTRCSCCTSSGSGLRWGWKNLYDDDQPMLTPEQTMTEVSPVPDPVTHQ